MCSNRRAAYCNFRTFPSPTFPFALHALHALNTYLRYNFSALLISSALTLLHSIINKPGSPSAFPIVTFLGSACKYAIFFNTTRCVVHLSRTQAIIKQSCLSTICLSALHLPRPSACMGASLSFAFAGMSIPQAQWGILVEIL